MLTRLILASLLIATPLFAAGADAAYDTLLETFKAKQYAQALPLAETFVKDHADHQYAGAAYYMGGNSGLHAAEYARGEALYRGLLEKHPDNRHAGKTRDELVTLLDAARKLDDCIAQCQANFKAEPESANRDRWQYMVGQCRFRKWEFEQAEKDLKAFKRDFPKSRWVATADSYLGRINPAIKVDEHGVVAGYTGKFADDDRFKAALRNLPGYVKDGMAAVNKALGTELKTPRVLFVFEDKGYVRDTNRAFVETIAIDYKPTTRMLFYTEHIVVSEPDFASRVAHELKHAAFRDAMGVAYLDLPTWLREGLAVLAAGQFDDRLAAIAGGEIFSGRDPRKILDGIDDADHDTNDYLEDAAAFLWLETRRKGALTLFCKRLLAGEDYMKLYAEIAGMAWREALIAAAAHALKLVSDAMGDGETQYEKIRAEDARNSDKAKWLAGAGKGQYEAWLEKFAGHPLAPNVRYSLGKALVLAREFERGRGYLREVLAQDQLRSTICDDAQYWVARSYELAGDTANAGLEWGVLLRDYSWSRQAIDNRTRYKAAGPVKHEPGK